MAWGRLAWRHGGDLGRVWLRETWRRLGDLRGTPEESLGQARGRPGSSIWKPGNDLEGIWTLDFKSY